MIKERIDFYFQRIFYDHGLQMTVTSVEGMLPHKKNAAIFVSFVTCDNRNISNLM